MNTVQHLLDSHGPPPSEICLDWAYQLLSLANESQSPISASWTTLQVDKTGQLSLTNGSPIQEHTLADLAQQLLEWSANCATLSEPPSNSSFDAVATLNHHRTLIELLKVGQPHNSTVSRGVVGATEIDETHRSTPITDSSLHLSSEDSPSTASSTPTNVKWAKFEKSKSRPRFNPLLWGVAAVFVAVAVPVLLVLSRGSGKPQSENPVLSNSRQASSENRPMPQRVEEERDDGPNAELKNLATSQDLQPSMVDSADTLESAIGLSLSDPLQGMSLVQGSSSGSATQPIDLSESTKPTDLSNPRSEKTAEDQTGALQLATTSSENSSSDQSVESMLAEAAKVDPKVKSLDTEVDASGVLKLPTQFLDIESMLQVQEVTAKIRIRQPMWQLRIATTDEFSVEPAEMQSLAEKQTMRWTLSAKELKPRKGQEPTKVVVFAQLAGKRADIKWKIVAGCDDLPNIVVPLNVERLDLMLSMLQTYQQRLSSGVTSIKDSMELPGLPREQKSILTAQRKAMEREGSLVLRARQIIADASLFVGWMDRSLEMHGNLVDQFGNQDTKLLQIGEPELSNSIQSSDPASGDQDVTEKP